MMAPDREVLVTYAVLLFYISYNVVCFSIQDQEKLASFISRNYNTKLEPVDLSVKGWNWGQAKFEGI